MDSKFYRLSGALHPIIQAGMVWTSGWKLASAVSNAGGLGTIGAGSMRPEVLQAHIANCKTAVSKKPFAINIPIMNGYAENHIETCVKNEVPIVITSAGSPKKITSQLKQQGVKVFHVVSSLNFALKSQDAGVDAIIAEGFEAGGHNGIEETTTLVLLQELFGQLEIPFIAAGGIGSGRAMLAAEALGAVASQVGSLFVTTAESSVHPSYKERLIAASAGETKLSMKKHIPVRLLKNAFAEQVQQAEAAGASKEDLTALLGKGRAMLGMFEGDLEQGELEIGQIVSVMKDKKPAAQVVTELMQEYEEAKERLGL